MSLSYCLLFLFFSFVPSGRSTTNEVLQEKIVIIGAGASGISAASKLLDHGYENIVVLEAEDRIGGRIWTKYDGDKFLEFGGKWIMGESGNILYELAKKANIIGYNIEDLNQIYINSNGEDIAQEKMAPIWSLYNEIISTFQNKRELVSDLFKKYIYEFNSNDLDKDIITSFLKWLVETISPVTDWNDETGNGFSSAVTIQGGTGTFTTSVNSILQILMNTYPESDLSPKWQKIIELNAEVKQISWNQSKPTVLYTKGAATEHTLGIEAEHIIVTIPLGVLKRQYKNLFVDPLPEKKVEAIKSFAVGTVNKIFLTYEQQWWPKDSVFHVIWNQDDIQTLEESDKWLSNIGGLSTEEHYPTTLILWIIEKGPNTSETYSDTVVYAKSSNFVKRVFANQGYNITEPIKTDRTKWQHYPHFRGSYSYRGADASNRHITNADLREPLKNENGKETVLFAGEATHDKYYATLHGAIESGYAAAERIIEMHKKL